MTKRCLLLQFPDSREVFTNEKNYQNLLNFSKTFGVQMMTVEADEPELLTTKEIAKLFCDQNKEDLSTCSYRIVNQQIFVKNFNENVSFSNISRENMLKQVSDVRSHIESQFLKGNIVKIKELYQIFNKYNIAVSTLYRHLSHVKKKLKAQGRKVIKISTGAYQLA